MLRVKANLASSQGEWDSDQPMRAFHVQPLPESSWSNSEEALPKLAPSGHVCGMRKATRPADRAGEN